MWRNLINNCGRSLFSILPQTATKNTLLKFCFDNQSQQSILIRRAALYNVESVNVSAPVIGGRGVDEYFAAAETIIRTLETRFHLKREEIEIILSNETLPKSCRTKPLMETLDLLCSEGVKRKNIVEYPWVLTLGRKSLLEKLKLLESLKGYRDINDFVPFLRINLTRLRRLVSSLNRETNHVDYGNRVYFIAEQLKVPPATVTKYLANRLFVLEMNLEMFKTNLQHMINYNVESMSILKDLWGFRYAPQAVQLRLKRAVQAKKEKIMPWMVRCTEPKLQKSLQLALDELEVLGDRANVAEYIGERLGFSVEEAKAIMNKHPQVHTVRVTKIKEVLDYLLDEAKFTRHEIAQVPRVLCHSLVTTKERIDELGKYGCRPTSLVIVCRSKKEYEKFLQQWVQHPQNFIKDKAKEQEV